MRLLAIGAHPDDETMLAGGTLAMYAARGVEVYVLCATRGEGGECGEPPLCRREELGQVREGELRCAIMALGAREVRFLDYIDRVDEAGNLAPLDTDPDELTAQIVAQIRDLRPDVVITHGTRGEYGHPHHVQLNLAVTESFFAVGDPARYPDNGGEFAPRKLYYWVANHPAVPERLRNQDDEPHVVLDVRPWLDAKEAAAQCHRTQHALFYRVNKTTRVRDALLKTEPFHRRWPQEVGKEVDLFDGLEEW